MNTITIQKEEYSALLDKQLRYEYFRQIIEEDVFSPPPTKSLKEVAKAFEMTGKYNKKFLNSFKKGLERSPYFKI